MGHCDCQFRRQRWRLAAGKHTEGAWVERCYCSERAGTLMNQGVLDMRSCEQHIFIL